MNHSVVGRCIINPYLDNKSEIYKPTSNVIGAFTESEADAYRRECAALRTHKLPNRRGYEVKDAKSDTILNERSGHDILNTNGNNFHDLESTTKVAESETLEKVTSECYEPVNANRQRERERVERKMNAYYGNVDRAK